MVWYGRRVARDAVRILRQPLGAQSDLRTSRLALRQFPALDALTLRRSTLRRSPSGLLQPDILLVSTEADGFAFFEGLEFEAEQGDAFAGGLGNGQIRRESDN